MSVGSIRYAYEDKAIPEVLEYSHKDTANECVAQYQPNIRQRPVTERTTMELAIAQQVMTQKMALLETPGAQ